MIDCLWYLCDDDDDAVEVRETTLTPAARTVCAGAFVSSFLGLDSSSGLLLIACLSLRCFCLLTVRKDDDDEGLERSPFGLGPNHVVLLVVPSSVFYPLFLGRLFYEDFYVWQCFMLMGKSRFFFLAFSHDKYRAKKFI